MAFITFAKPKKNTLPAASSAIFANSLKLAPAQKVRSPPLFKTITLTSSLSPAFLIKSTNCCKISPGNEL